jgi:hypothetical protein
LQTGEQLKGTTIGPRLALHGTGWKGKYTKVDFKYLMAVTVWEKNADVSCGLQGSLNIVPNTWISDDFKSVAFPNKEGYFIFNNPTTEYFKANLVPQKTVWREFDVHSFSRLIGCESQHYTIYLSY